MRNGVFFSRFRLSALVLFLICGEQAWTQDDTRPPATPERIAAELKKIESAANWHATHDDLGRLWSLLASDYQDEGDVQRAEEAYGRAVKLLGGSSSAPRSYAITLDGLGSLYLESGRAKEAEGLRRKALALFEALGDETKTAELHGHLATNLIWEARYKDAEKEATEAIAGLRGKEDASASEEVSALLTRAFARCLQHRCKDGLTDAQEAMEIVRRQLRPDSLETISALVTLGYALWNSGNATEGGEAFRAALRIVEGKRDLPQPILTNARIGVLRQYAAYLHATHYKQEALQAENEIAQLKGEVRQSCNGCTVSVVGLSSGLR